LFDTSRKKKKKSQESNNVFDVRHLVSHLKALDRDAQVFLMWASLMGHSFNFSQIKRLIMSNEMTDIVLASSSGGESVVSGNSDVIVTKPDDEIDSQLTQNLISSVEQEEQQTTRAMGGLQIALNEGVIHYKTGNVFAFIHDRYYQAASMLIDDKDKEKMHSIIANMLMSESIDEEYHDVFLTADHIIQSVEIIRQLDTEKARYRETLIKAGNEASVSGALAIAINYYECALSLLPESERWTDGVESSFEETLLIYMKLLELNWAHNEDSTDDKTRMTLDQILEHTESRPYERAQAWRIQAKIYFQQAKYQQGIEIILKGLNELGTIQGLALNIKDDEMFDLYYQVKESITQKGFEHLSEVGPCKDKKLLAIMSLLNEGCTGAYWINPTLVDFFALKLCELSLCSGYGASSGGGFIWTGFTATRVSDFNFAAELGKFGMVIAEKYAGNSEIAKAISVNYAMLAQWTGVHVREYIYQYQRAYKYAIAGGDKVKNIIV
jgi:predicted ATPase